MKYNIVAKFVFLEIEAENETWAIEYTDEAFTHYIFHPQTNEKIFALYEIEAVEHTLAPDVAGVCRKVNHFYVEGVCANCGCVQPRHAGKA